MTDFYFTLLSNSTGDKNTISDFTTYLPNRLQFNNDHEVALISFSYHHSWLHLDYNDAIFSVTTKQNEKLVMRVPPGHYKDNQTFINALNSQLESNSLFSRFEYEETLNKAVISVDRGETVVLHEYLAGVLGFDGNEYTAFINNLNINLLHGEASFKITDRNYGDSIISLPEGAYEDYNLIVDKLNAAIRIKYSNGAYVKLEYIETSNRVKLSLSGREYLEFDEDLGKILGFDTFSYTPDEPTTIFSQTNLEQSSDYTLTRDYNIKIRKLANENADPHTVVITSGNYQNIHFLLSEINNQLESSYYIIHPITRFSYTSKKINLILGNDVTNLKFNDRLADILGFNKDQVSDHSISSTTNKLVRAQFERPELKCKHEGVNGVDLNLTRHNLFIYSKDLIAPSLVGGEYVPLLGIIPTNDDNFSRYVVYTFREPAYYKIQNNQLTKIHISIKDDTGKQIKFLSGRSVLVLHFRPIQI